jgi:hypothetical protein
MQDVSGVESKDVSWEYFLQNILSELEYSKNILRIIILRIFENFLRNEHLNLPEHLKTLEDIPG